MWTCPKCEESLEDEFDVCWQCGTSIDGAEDPNFETADEAGPIFDSVEDGEVKDLDEILDEFGEPLPDLVDCYQAENVTEARFVADQLRLSGIPSVSDRHNINVETLGGWAPSAWGYGPRVRVRPADLTRALAWIENYKQKRRDRADRDQ